MTLPHFARVLLPTLLAGALVLPVVVVLPPLTVLAARPEADGPGEPLGDLESGQSAVLDGLVKAVNKDVIADVRKAAEAGDVDAQLSLAVVYLRTDIVDQDIPEAVRWLNEASRRGSVVAEWVLGALDEHGVGADRNPAAAARHYRRAADQGFVPAQFDLGTLYINGDGVTQDYADAARWLRAAAGSGYAPAQRRLGYLYNKGLGVDKDESKAMELYRLAAAQGDAVAEYNIGIIHQDNTDPSDDQEAAELIRSAATKGYPRAQYWLGAMYKEGKGVSTNNAEALAWRLRAAEQGFVPAMRDLGFDYMYGESVPTNHAEGVRWLTQAAERGSVEAKVNLGHAYMTGLGVEKNGQTALKWLREAAAAGNAVAMSNMGSLYFNGKLVPSDWDEAAYWYYKAAARGYEKAASILSEITNSALFAVTLKRRLIREDPTQKLLVCEGDTIGQVVAKLGPPDITGSTGSRKPGETNTVWTIDWMYPCGNVRLRGGVVVDSTVTLTEAEWRTMKSLAPAGSPSPIRLQYYPEEVPNTNAIPPGSSAAGTWVSDRQDCTLILKDDRSWTSDAGYKGIWDVGGGYLMLIAERPGKSPTTGRLTLRDADTCRGDRPDGRGTRNFKRKPPSGQVTP